MRRWLFISAAVALLAGSSFIALVSLAGAKSSLAARQKTKSPHIITVTPWGPDQATIDDTKSRLLKNPALQRYLAGKSYRMLSFDFLESGVKEVKSEPPSRYRATFFNYTSNRAIIALGRFTDSAIEVSLSTEQPLPSPEEFEAAVNILTKDPMFGPAIRAGSLQPYSPMPPLVDINLPTGKVERTLTVGLLPKDAKGSNEVVGVNMIRESVIRYKGGAPPTSNAVELNCGVSNANQTSNGRFVSEPYQVTITRGADLIWEFLMIRPSSSSGNNASGIELQTVKFRGKLVLARANAPVLNVQYYRNLCGPYRDWSYQEGMFVANGTYVVGGSGNGIMLCTDEPQTVLDNGTDTGNFRGVAIYDREEVTLVSELNAGWYRYISKWIFHDEGIISPRFGYGATTNSCVCRGHIHHVYWRFDFDLATAANNGAAEHNQGVLKPMETESMRPRLSDDRFWVVSNSVTGEAVVIKPGPLDGNYDKYGQGDLWLLRGHFPTEIDDAGQPSGGCSTCAHINPMVNGESIMDQDIVVWYGGHWMHDHFDAPQHGDGPNVHGPDLILQKY
ncbi:MAG TPA: hypothetical protein VI837_10040 [Blastocatellia bacterium]|nr:hypothetical protein [Blastocatellia bacterium]